MKKTSLSFMFIVPISMVGCVSTPSLDAKSRPQNWGVEVNKAHNFYQISPMLFRSEQPHKTLIPDIKAQNIAVVINLRAHNKDQKNLSGQGFELIHIPIHTWAMNREDLLTVMQAIQHAQHNNQKVLIHCYHGSDRTGASIAMYRIIFEQWSIQQALDEMKHGGYGFHPVWTNIDTLFTPENIKWIQQQLSNPSIHAQ